jgi:hypothetical protein
MQQVFSETLVPVYQATRRDIPDHKQAVSNRHDNLSSEKDECMWSDSGSVIVAIPAATCISILLSSLYNRMWPRRGAHRRVSVVPAASGSKATCLL